MNFLAASFFSWVERNQLAELTKAWTGPFVRERYEVNIPAFCEIYWKSFSLFAIN